jgi:hypothetical protein
MRIESALASQNAPHQAPKPSQRQRLVHHRRGVGASVGTVALFLAAACFASAASALPIGCVKQGKRVQCPTVSYKFQTLNDNADITFNQLLGINQAGVIAGYFGSGLQGHPNKGYLLFPPYVQNYYADTNFPGSAQTQVTGLNNAGILVGFYSTMNNASVNGAPPVNDNHGWYKVNGHFSGADFPTQGQFTPSSPPMDQLLGVNNKGVAVGFFTDSHGTNHGYTYNIRRSTFQLVTVPKFTNVTAAAINDARDIAGFGTINGTTEGFLLANGKTTAITFPGASSTQALGLNNNDEVVGVYTVGSGTNTVTHGFSWYPGYRFHTINAPRGMDTTAINGVNGCGDVVGFYVDGAGNTDGLLGNARYSTYVSPVSGAARDASAAAVTSKRIKAKLPKGC